MEFFDSLEVEEARELLGSSLSCQKSTPRDVPGDDEYCFKGGLRMLSWQWSGRL